MSQSGGDSSVANGVVPRGAMPLRKPPAKAAARSAKVRVEHRVHVRRMVEQRDPQLALAAGGRIAARKSDLGVAAMIGEHGAQVRAPIAAFAARELRQRADRDARKRGLDRDDRCVACRGRGEREANRFEIDEERVGPDVVRLERLAVEGGRIVRDGREKRPIEHEIAVHRVEPACAQRRHERLPLLDGYLRVAAAFEHEIAVEHAALERAAEVRFGLPAIVGAEELERRERRDELHHRGGVERAIDLLRKERPAPVHFLDDDADRVERNLRVEEHALDLARQRRYARFRDDERQRGRPREERWPRESSPRRLTRHRGSRPVRSTSSANSSSVTM